MPMSDGRYRKVLQPDPQAVWGTGRPEVRYLLQSQTPRWPHFTAGQVISPGVASAVRSPDDTWALYFAGFDPSDRPLIDPGVAEPDHRRPFFVKLRTAVPPDRSVASVSDAELATWLEPATR